jgi:hypothetical protein
MDRVFVQTFISVPVICQWPIRTPKTCFTPSSRALLTCSLHWSCVMYVLNRDYGTMCSNIYSPMMYYLAHMYHLILSFNNSALCLQCNLFVGFIRFKKKQRLFSWKVLSLSWRRFISFCHRDRVFKYYLCEIQPSKVSSSWKFLFGVPYQSKALIPFSFVIDLVIDLEVEPNAREIIAV